MFHRALRFVIAYATGGIPYRPVFSDHGMSALGQKRTFAVHQLMSALPPIATAKADFRTRSCLLYPRKRTFAVHLPMSAMGQ